jgi:hypothetical protein
MFLNTKQKTEWLQSSYFLIFNMPRHHNLHTTTSTEKIVTYVTFGQRYCCIKRPCRSNLACCVSTSYDKTQRKSRQRMWSIWKTVCMMLMHITCLLTVYRLANLLSLREDDEFEFQVIVADSGANRSNNCMFQIYNMRSTTADVLIMVQSRYETRLLSSTDVSSNRTNNGY